LRAAAAGDKGEGTKLEEQDTREVRAGQARRSLQRIHER